MFPRSNPSYEILYLIPSESSICSIASSFFKIIWISCVSCSLCLFRNWSKCSNSQFFFKFSRKFSDFFVKFEKFFFRSEIFFVLNFFCSEKNFCSDNFSPVFSNFDLICFLVGFFSSRFFGDVSAFLQIRKILLIFLILPFY